MIGQGKLPPKLTNRTLSVHLYTTYSTSFYVQLFKTFLFLTFSKYKHTSARIQQKAK